MEKDSETWQRVRNNAMYHMPLTDKQMSESGCLGVFVILVFGAALTFIFGTAYLIFS